MGHIGGQGPALKGTVCQVQCWAAQQKGRADVQLSRPFRIPANWAVNPGKVVLVGDTADAQVGGEVKTEAGAGPFLDEYQLPTRLNPVFKWGLSAPGTGIQEESLGAS